MVAHLDRRMGEDSPGVTAVWTASYTTYTLPFSVAVDGSEGELVVARRDNLNLLSSTRPAANQIRAYGDLTGIPLWIGVLYDFRYEPARIYYRPEGGPPETRGRLQLRYVDLHLAAEGVPTIHLSLEGRGISDLVGMPVRDGRLHFGVHSQNTQASIEVSDRSPLPLALTGLDWEGHFTQRNRRL